MNSFTCIGRGHGAPCTPATETEWYEMRNAQWLDNMCRRIELGEEALKGQLPVWTPRCAEFRNNHRSESDALKPLNRLMFDVDDKGRTNEIMEHIVYCETGAEDGALEPFLGPFHVLMVEESVRRGTHILVELPEGMEPNEAQRIFSDEIGIPVDPAVKNVAGCIYMVPQDHVRVESKRFRDPAEVPLSLPFKGEEQCVPEQCDTETEEPAESLSYNSIPYSEIITKWWSMYNEGKEPVKSNRDVLTYELAVNLRHICGFDRELMDRVIPCYDEFPHAQKMKCIDSALAEKRTQMPQRLRAVLEAVKRDHADDQRVLTALDEAQGQDELFYYNRLPKASMPQGISDSIAAAGPVLAMPVITAVCPAIGALATGVKVVIHGAANTLNLMSYIEGEAGSGKGQLDPIIQAWMHEIQMQDDIYTRQEEEWRQRARSTKGVKQTPEEPKLPVRFLTLNNTVANLAHRLSNTDGKHSFSFTPEADTVAQKWRQSISDFSVMLRQAYDGSRYDREAKSAEAVSVHIERLLWNVTLCGTQDALYRVINNYTDGLLSRMALARTPDNTFTPLTDKPHLLTERQRERIMQVAHLLPLMQGTVELSKLEAKSREWVEHIRIEAMKNDDKVMARCRLRDHITAQRMTACLMLCQVCERLIRQHGLNGAERELKRDPELWKRMMQRAQTPAMMTAYEVIADSLLDNDLYFFRDRLEVAYSGGPCASARVNKNGGIYDSLGDEFTLDEARRQALAVKGPDTTPNTVYMMLKNWRKQGIAELLPDGTYKKVV